MEALVALAFLACPIGIGVMMWLMAKGMGGSRRSSQPESLEALRSEHERLGGEIARLERDQARRPPSVVP